jgi:hypothetical protein
MSEHDQLHALLVDQISAYRSLLDTLQRERACLIQFDPAGVESLSKEKDTAILKLRLLEEERVRLTGRIGEGLGSVEPLTLARLAELSGDDRFRRSRLQLISLLQSIVELNEFNRVLIERSSGVVKSALSFLSAFGVRTDPAPSGAMISREA